MTIEIKERSKKNLKSFLRKLFENQFPFATSRWTLRWHEESAARWPKLIPSFGFESATSTAQEKSGNKNVDSLQPIGKTRV